MHRPRRRALPALLMVGAGCAVLAGGTYAGLMSNFRICLSLVLVAAVLSVAAIALYSKEPISEEIAQRGPARLWIALAALIFLHGLIALFIERTNPGDVIDCFTFQRDSLVRLKHGIDPYGGTQPNIYSPAQTAKFYGPGMVVNGRVQEGFPYLPVTLAWDIPGYLLGDIRYSYVLALMLSSAICFAIYSDKRGFCLASFLLLNPIGFFVESRCWTEPMVFLGLTATLYGAIKKRRWLPIAAGLFLATKQYNFLALPFLGFLVSPFRWKSYWKLLGLALAVAMVTVLPFAVWNPRALWHDLVPWLLDQPIRTDSLSLAVLFPAILKVGPLFVLAFIAWALRIGSRSKAMFAAGYGTCLLFFFLTTSKQAFCNYYLLIGETMLLAAAGFYGGLPRGGAGGEQ